MQLPRITSPIPYKGARITLHDFDGQQWIEARSLTTGLKFSDPRQVLALYEAHRHLFDATNTCLLARPQPARTVSIRAFTLWGAALGAGCP